MSRSERRQQKEANMTQPEEINAILKEEGNTDNVVEQPNTTLPSTPEVIQLQPTPPVVVAPIVPVEQVIRADAPVQVKSAESTLSVNAKIIISQIESYMSDMKPGKPMSPEIGARNQVTLYRAILNTINNLESEFNEVFTYILKSFHEERKGVFSEIYVFRFMEHIAIHEAERRLFQRLLNLIKITADPKGRELALRQIDLGKTVDGLSSIGQQRIMSYFNR